MEYHLLIIGAGSVGGRHAKNFVELGCRVSIVDPRLDRLNGLSSSVNVVGKYQVLTEAFNESQYSGVVVCSPTKYHLDQSISAIGYGLPILLEKPIAMSFTEANKLYRVVEARRPRPPILLGYTWRWCEALRQFREHVRSRSIGDLYFVRFTMSAHLADWHPWEPYQEFFMSKKEQGGGALLDESHWVDQMIWMFGLPDQVVATIDKVSSLEITSDDSVEILAMYREGLKVFIHLDIYGRPHERSIKAIGENGAIEWMDMLDYSVLRLELNKPEETIFQNERNDMFVELAKDFVQILASENVPACSIRDGLRVMRVIDAIRLSSEQGRVVALNEIQ